MLHLLLLSRKVASEGRKYRRGYHRLCSWGDIRIRSSWEGGMVEDERLTPGHLMNCDRPVHSSAADGTCPQCVRDLVATNRIDRCGTRAVHRIGLFGSSV